MYTFIAGGEKYKKTSTNGGFPGNLGLQGGSFVNGGVIPRINGIKSVASGVGDKQTITVPPKDGSPPSRNSLERG
jgi:hypothetical protein